MMKMGCVPLMGTRVFNGQDFRGADHLLTCRQERYDAD